MPLLCQGSEASSCGGLMLRSIPNIIAAMEHLLSSSSNRGGGGEYQQQQRRGRARPSEEGQRGEEDLGLGGEVEQGQHGDEDPGPEWRRRRPSAVTATKIVRGDGGQGGPNRGPSRRFTASWHDSEGGDEEEEL
ncbi:uncharacterized protein LOC125508593 isoform X1 [Triticum urartu]|uniref:uncharacterized protein LOC125508593 isoform X1 n=1 Tax=Triticum urartu TaxID=4572 RepID=UPI002043B341|nr:uncharacterized protein LOC125508593 isoform X1 [Triticum urartu]